MDSDRKILLIDDEQIMHDLAYAYLERAGYQLLSAYTGENGLRVIREKKPDVVLLDYMMPGLDGERTYSELRRNPIYRDVRDTPVIFLTARGGDDDLKQRLIKKGIAAYLQKPFGLRELSNIVDNVFILSDIRKNNRHLRRQVKATRELLLNIVQNAPVGIFTTNGSGDIVQANAHIQRLFALPELEDPAKVNVFQNELLKNTFIAEGVRSVLDRNTDWQGEISRWQSAHGEIVNLDVHFVPLGANIHGGLDGVIGIIEDVTEKKRHDSEMRILGEIALAMQQAMDLDQLLHLVLTAITAGQALGFTRAMIFLVDERRQCLKGAMGVGPANAEKAAEIWTRLAGESLALDEFLHKYGSQLPAADDFVNRHILSIELPFSLENPLIKTILKKQPYRPSQRELPMIAQVAGLAALELQDFVVVPLVTSDKLLGMIIADNKFGVETITESRVQLLTLFAGQAATAIERAHNYQQLEIEKKKLEDALNELQQTQERLVHSERLAVIGEMAAHVAHEIRNPLVTIGGFARQLAKKALSENDDDSPANIIAEEVLRLEKILANVLNFTRLPQPAVAFHNINDLILSVCEQMKTEFSEQGIELKVSMQADLPDFYFDEQQLKQVLLNLLRNSQQSITSGGVVGIETHIKGKDVLIIVMDNGEGIPRESLEVIFNPFYTTKEHGTGLGLAISQQIIHDHGGEIKVYSEVGKGTVFKIHLPIDMVPDNYNEDKLSLQEVIF